MRRRHKKSLHLAACSLTACALALPAACGQAKGHAPEQTPQLRKTSEEDTAKKPAETPPQKGAKTGAAQETRNVQATAKTTKDPKSTTTPATRPAPALPKPKVELPDIPYDKAQLSGIRKLDEMIAHAAELEACMQVLGGHYQALRQSSNTSLNGDASAQIKGILTIVDAVQDFEHEGAALAKLGRQSFMKRYASDDEFSSQYRERYSAAEEQLDDVIKDNKARRAVVSVMMNSYRGTPRTQLGYLESILEESARLRESAIGKVVRSVETDMMVADFKKGRELIDLLQNSRNKLRVVQPLDPKSEKIREILTKIDEKEESRSKEIAAAREATRFPARYAATNAPQNAEAIERSMKEALEAAGFEVAEIAIASTWIAVNSPLGVHLYNQIDFHVAVKSSIADEAKAGVLDLLYVTGKTGTPALSLPFARRSSGRIGQMLQSNL